mgnify:CR=1 FL=1
MYTTIKQTYSTVRHYDFSKYDTMIICAPGKDYTNSEIKTISEWLENDGLVNTISAMAPSSAPSAQFDKDNINKGIWYVMPTYRGDHMSLQGGFFKTNTDVERLYTEHLNMINSL